MNKQEWKKNSKQTPFHHIPCNFTRRFASTSTVHVVYLPFLAKRFTIIAFNRVRYLVSPISYQLCCYCWWIISSHSHSHVWIVCGGLMWRCGRRVDATGSFFGVHHNHHHHTCTQIHRDWFNKQSTHITHRITCFAAFVNGIDNMDCAVCCIVKERSSNRRLTIMAKRKMK